MITNVSKYQTGGRIANVSGTAVALAQKAGGFKLDRKPESNRYFFWSQEWKTFLSLARKAKIEVQW